MKAMARWPGAGARCGARLVCFGDRWVRGCVPLLVVIAVALGACGSPDGAVPGELTVDGQQLRDAGGGVLLTLDDLPGEIAVNGDSAFGASTRFTDASPSPDGRWIAVTTAGTAHGAGWLLRSGTRNALPAAFQYGGRVLPGPWSSDAEYAVFVHEGPAGGSTLSVAATRARGDTVADRSRAVRLSDHDERAPQDTHYVPLEWDGAELLFEVGERRWLYHAGEDAVRRGDGS